MLNENTKTAKEMLDTSLDYALNLVDNAGRNVREISENKAVNYSGLTMMPATVFSQFLSMAMSALDYISPEHPRFRRALTASITKVASMSMGLSGNISELPNEKELSENLLGREVDIMPMGEKMFRAAVQFDDIVKSLDINKQVAMEFVRKHFESQSDVFVNLRDYYLSFCHELRCQFMTGAGTLKFEGFGEMGFFQPNTSSVKVKAGYSIDDEPHLEELKEAGYITETTTRKVNIAKIKADMKVSALPAICENLLENIEKIPTPGQDFWRKNGSPTNRKFKKNGSAMAACQVFMEGNSNEPTE